MTLTSSITRLLRTIAVVAIGSSLSSGVYASERAAHAHLNSRLAAQAPNGFSGICARYKWACARSGQSASLSGSQIRLAQSINRQINRQVRQIEDRKQYGREDYWALPTRRGGDCEDIALLKKSRLVEQGVLPERLLLATVLDGRNGNHAVLVLRTEQGDYILDSLENRILHWSKTPYTFLRMQNPQAPHRWDAILSGGIFGG